ncbi:ribonucleoside-diphosphate reductase [Halogeometricum borinquense]|uniref:Ribonucleoside-diphosphate reductase n=1 Tax=Halogeometricum borinquense TaxID=60847 RepID=A0A482TKL2_9EURY|nr:ribonucleotide-diphosphate reductase subunit beta [Halogeometricum borinquense]RYJ14493.1 ribonucleoside-diphosphate reductase [Halogeometricum borinquense]
MSAENRGRAERYFRHATERHWSPYEIDLAADRAAISDLGRSAFTQLRATIAMFGAGEENVTEDLVPLAATTTNKIDQRFVASHIYEEAKHAAFFERYWKDVIRPAEDARGLDPTDPTADRWFTAAYEEIFNRTETAMNQLLDDDTPTNRANAYCHYHLTVEGVFGQTGFHAIEATFDPETDGPSLPGLVEGISHVRQDEGRHVGYGMNQLAELLQRTAVERSFVEETVETLAEPVDAVVERMGWRRLPGPDSDDLTAFAVRKRRDRLAQLSRGAESEHGTVN